MNRKTVYMEKAAALFGRGYNCAQSVLLTMQDFWNEEKPSEPKIASAFGAGIGRRGSLCGALTGGVIAIGQKYGSNEPIQKGRDEAYSMALKFYDGFQKEFGSVFCRNLIGYDLSDPKELKKAWDSRVFLHKCVHIVEKTVDILIDLT